MIIKKTPLYKEHIEQGGTMVEFAGYHLPITYSSIKNEHSVVRQKVGVFDVSHMAEFFISGESATRFLQNITVNDVAKLSIGQVHYSLMCNNYVLTTWNHTYLCDFLHSIQFQAFLQH